MSSTTQRQLKIFILIICYFANLILGGPDQRRLLKTLLVENQYDPLERPVQNDSDTLPVSINLALQQIITFYGKDEFIVISGWMVLMWNDHGLRWNPEEYGNIQTIRIPSSNIWIPDILLYNSADGKFDSTMRVNAVIQHTGDVLYVPPGIFKSTCPFNIADFPFDTQNCTLKFGSWSFDDAGINLTAESNKGQLDAYAKNAEWELEDFSATNNALKYDCCPNLYPYVLYTIRIRRRSLYYVTNIVVPCFLISCLTILGFLLAPESGEKLTLRELESDYKYDIFIRGISLEITTLLSIVMFSLLMTDILPPSSTSIPIISVYFMCVTCMSAMGVVSSVLVISLHFRNPNNYIMPVWIRKYICHYLAWLLCMNRPRHDLTWRSIRRKWGSPKEQPNSINQSNDDSHHKSPSAPLLNNSFELSSNNVINVDRKSSPFVNEREKYRLSSVLEFPLSPVSEIQQFDHPQDLSRVLHSCDSEMIRSELRVLISQLAILTKHTRETAEHEDESQDWKFAAMVIDRLCLVLFTVAMAIFTGLTLFSAPNFFQFQ